MSSAKWRSPTPTGYARRAGLAALETLWSDEHGQYLCLDRTTGDLIDSASIGGILPVFAAVPKERAHEVARTIERTPPT